MCLITRYGSLPTLLEEFLYEISAGDLSCVLRFVWCSPKWLNFFPPLRFEFCKTETKALSQLLSPHSSRFFLSISQSASAIAFQNSSNKSKKSTLWTYCHFEGVRNLVPNSLSNNIRITYCYENNSSKQTLQGKFI